MLFFAQKSFSFFILVCVAVVVVPTLPLEMCFELRIYFVFFFFFIFLVRCCSSLSLFFLYNFKTRLCAVCFFSVNCVCFSLTSTSFERKSVGIFLIRKQFGSKSFDWFKGSFAKMFQTAALRNAIFFIVV